MATNIKTVNVLEAKGVILRPTRLRLYRRERRTQSTRWHLLGRGSYLADHTAVYHPILSLTDSSVLYSEFGLGPLGIFHDLIATQILSHHVDDYTLVSAFFLFSIGCLNMLLGLIFRESAKDRQSPLSWRAEAKGIPPKSVDSDSPKQFVFAGKGLTAIRRSFAFNE